VFCGCFEDSSWEWLLCSDKSIVKSSGIEYCNTFVKKVLVLLLPILFCPSIVLVLASIVSKPESQSVKPDGQKLTKKLITNSLISLF